MEICSHSKPSTDREKIIFSSMNYLQCAASPCPHLMKSTRKVKRARSVLYNQESCPLTYPALLCDRKCCRYNPLLNTVFFVFIFFACISPDGCNWILWYILNRFFTDSFFRGRFFVVVAIWLYLSSKRRYLGLSELWMGLLTKAIFLTQKQGLRVYLFHI